MIKAVCVDFDDTLCMTEEACFYIENDALTAMGRNAMSREIHVQTWGKTLQEGIALRSPGIEVLAFIGVVEPIRQKYVAEGKADAVPVANLDVLRTLRSQGMHVSLLTSRKAEELRHILETENHDLHEVIESYYHQDNTEYLKPDPRVFAGLLQATGYQPKDVVYVGDSVSDAAASFGAGMHFVASLESGLRTKADFAPFPNTVFISKFTDLPAAINGMQY